MAAKTVYSRGLLINYIVKPLCIKSQRVYKRQRRIIIFMKMYFNYFSIIPNLISLLIPVSINLKKDMLKFEFIEIFNSLNSFVSNSWSQISDKISALEKRIVYSDPKDLKSINKDSVKIQDEISIMDRQIWAFMNASFSNVLYFITFDLAVYLLLSLLLYFVM